MILCCFHLCIASQANQHSLIYIPLDSRPCNQQFPKLLAPIAGQNLIQPRSSLLGDDRKDADTNELLYWMKKQPMKQAVSVISIDMMVFGGLLGSRSYNIDFNRAKKRVDKLFDYLLEVKTPIYLFGSLTRVAPTASSKNNKFYVSLIKAINIYYKIKYENRRDLNKDLKHVLRRVPELEFNHCLKVRERNLKIHQYIIKKIKNLNHITYVVGQDDARKKGPNIYESFKINQLAKKKNLFNKRFFYVHGVDQLGAVLLSRSMLSRLELKPKVYLSFSNSRVPKSTNRYESINIGKSVEELLSLSGFELTQEESRAETFLFVYGKSSYHERTSFQSLVEKKCRQGLLCALADIDFDYNNAEGIGTRQTGCQKLLYHFLEKQMFLDLSGYDSWNTAGNTFGTVIASLAMCYIGIKKKDLFSPVFKSQWLIHRLIDNSGFLYHARQEIRRLCKKKGYHPFDLSSRQKLDVENRTTSMMNSFSKSVYIKYLQDPILKKHGRKMALVNSKYVYPWSRVFELDISFQLK